MKKLLKLNLNKKEVFKMSDQVTGKTLTFDIECFYNYFLCTFVDANTGKVIEEVEKWNDKILNPKHTALFMSELIESNTLVSFNGNKYDILILSAFMDGQNNVSMKIMSDDIIQNRVMPWEFERKYKIRILEGIDHIDLIEPAFGMVSLKVYGARLKYPVLQEIPTPIKTLVTPAHRAKLKGYCINDCLVTNDLHDHVKPAIELRKEMGAVYGFDMRSLSDAQIGERVIVAECERVTGFKLTRRKMSELSLQFNYKAPDWITFKTDKIKNHLKLVESLTYNINKETGKVIIPPELGLICFWEHGKDAIGTELDNTMSSNSERISAINLQYKGVLAKDKPEEIKRELIDLKAENKELKQKRPELLVKQYNFQIGGIHSQHDTGSYYSDSDYEVFEIDVGSFYPNIILNAGYFVEQMGAEHFHTVYSSLVQQRMDAKARLVEIKHLLSGTLTDQARETLKTEEAEQSRKVATIKIVLNGFYGKLSSKYSPVYSPNMLVSVTLTGQLAILMLLEQLHAENITVLSANTDGINVRIHKNKREWLDGIVDDWCDVTGFTMDYNHYKMISYRDVNAYFYQHESGYMSGIGVFAGDSIRKSPSNAVCRDAIFSWVKDGVDIEDTINDCEDINAFLTLKKATGGCNKDGDDLGSTVRWYRSTATETAIHNNKTNNIVAGSSNGMPCQNLPSTLPDDIDYGFYIDETYKLMAYCGLLNDDLFYIALDDGSVFVSRHSACGVEEREISKFEFMENIGVTKSEIKKYNIK